MEFPTPTTLLEEEALQAAELLDLEWQWQQEAEAEAEAAAAEAGEWQAWSVQEAVHVAVVKLSGKARLLFTLRPRRATLRL